MLDRIRKAAEALPEWAVVSFGVTTVVALSLLDFWTGPDVAFSIFYLAPVGAAASVKGFRPSSVIALASAVGWGAAEAASGADYSSVIVPIWNSSSRLAVFLIVAALVASQRNQMKRAQQLARSDSLTGIANARAFEERANHELQRLRRQGGALSVAYIDLDDFKRVNDTLGHAAGDELLRKVAQQLDSETRAIDLVARLAGDEFGVLLPDTGKEGAAVALKDLARRVSSATETIPWNVTFSLGVATFHQAPDSVDQLISAADRLMYQSKREGKNRIVQIDLDTDDASPVISSTGSRTD